MMQTRLRPRVHTGAGLGADDYIPPLYGPEQLAWAKSLVDPVFCDRLACGAVTQSEAGLAKVFACGLAYPRSPQAPCSTFCQPWWPELNARYGYNCGVTGQVFQSAVLSTPQSNLAPAPVGNTQYSAPNPNYYDSSPAPREEVATPTPPPPAPVNSPAAPVQGPSTYKTDLQPAPVSGPASEVKGPTNIQISLPELDPVTGLLRCPAAYPFQSLEDGRTVCRKTRESGVPDGAAGDDGAAGGDGQTVLAYMQGLCESQRFVAGVSDCLVVAGAALALYLMTRSDERRGRR